MQELYVNYLKPPGNDHSGVINATRWTYPVVLRRKVTTSPSAMLKPPTLFVVGNCGAVGPRSAPPWRVPGLTL